MFHNKTNLAAPNDYDNDYDDDGQFRYDNILGDTRWSFIFTSSLSRLAKKLSRFKLHALVFTQYVFTFRSDKTLQDLVYKLVPGLYKSKCNAM